MKRRDFYVRYTKRALDVAVAGSALALGWPALAAIAGLVRWRLGSPVLFKQQRPGRNGSSFSLWKFRTMTDDRDHNGSPLPDGARLTKFGRFLRSTSLDELPELFNVLRGEMSLVGPRPLLICYLDRYTPEQARRHEVRPGITGWAQINGRNAIAWEQKFAYDVWYVDHVSLRLDIVIIAKTLAKILCRDGVTQPGSATAEEFMGSAFATSSEQETTTCRTS